MLPSMLPPSDSFLPSLGLFWFFIPSSVVITNDIMAYFCGLLLGRRIFRQPFLSISPNKTWEGYFGAIVYTVIYGFIMSGHISQVAWCHRHKLGCSASSEIWPVIIDPYRISSDLMC